MVALSSDSEEEGQSRKVESKEEADLRAAYAALRKAKRAFREKEAQKAGRGQGKTQTALETFWSPGKVREPPALQDVSPPQTGPKPYWLVAAKQEQPLEVVKQEKEVEAALKEPDPGSFGEDKAVVRNKRQKRKKSRLSGASRGRPPRLEEGKRQEEEARRRWGLGKKAFFLHRVRQEGRRKQELTLTEKKSLPQVTKTQEGAARGHSH